MFYIPFALVLNSFASEVSGLRGVSPDEGDVIMYISLLVTVSTQF